MCTVVTRFIPGRPVSLLAVRDEFERRSFDDPDCWWSDQPRVVGGRDRTAGGSWCVSDLDSGRTAVVLNRPEKPTGSPSRGLLPLLAVAHGRDWINQLDHTDMASFTLALITEQDVSAWEWTGDHLIASELSAGLHVLTPRGIDPISPLANRITPLFASTPWRDVLGAETRSAAKDALFVQREVNGAGYGTVFAQFINARPGSLQVSYSRTPWRADWTDREWS